MPESEILIYVLFVLGLFFLIKGADWLVLGASSMAKRYNISDFIIGLTIVSMGTSMPELIVNVVASMDNSPGIAIGNVIGSNLSNILLVLGVSAVIFPLPINEKTILGEIPYSLIATLLMAFGANAAIIPGQEISLIDRFDGTILMLFFLVFIAYVIQQTRRDRASAIDLSPPEGLQSIPKSILFMSLGMAGLYFGGQWVVDGGIHMASNFGMSESFVGLTVVALGTSLPELATSAVAAYRKNTEIAVANVVGSNIFNVLWVLGLSAIIRPIPFNPMINTDIGLLILVSGLLVGAAYVGKKHQLNRFAGVFFLLIYGLYVWYLNGRG